MILMGQATFGGSSLTNIILSFLLELPSIVAYSTTKLLSRYKRCHVGQTQKNERTPFFVCDEDRGFEMWVDLEVSHIRSSAAIASVKRDDSKATETTTEVTRQ